MLLPLELLSSALVKDVHVFFHIPCQHGTIYNTRLAIVLAISE